MRRSLSCSSSTWPQLIVVFNQLLIIICHYLNRFILLFKNVGGAISIGIDKKCKFVKNINNYLFENMRKEY